MPIWRTSASVTRCVPSRYPSRTKLPSEAGADHIRAKAKSVALCWTASLPPIKMRPAERMGHCSSTMTVPDRVAISKARNRCVRSPTWSLAPKA